MVTPQDIDKKFSVVNRAESFVHAGRGIYIFIKSTHNAWIHIIVAIAVILLGFVLNITRVDWMMIIFAIGLVFTSEAFNTAIEIDMDLTSPEYHPYAKNTKDVAAGAVLVSAFTALIIGVIVFAPYLI